MPRIVACNHCRILQRMPDPHPKTPMIPARLEWTTGEDYVYKDDKGHPVMVPAYDPVLEDFVDKHGHGLNDGHVLSGTLINVWKVDQSTWDNMDIIARIKDELRAQTNEWYEERDEYREAALQCYNAHGNPTLELGCRDYLDDSKRIGHAEYHDEDGRVITIPDKFRQYLCYLCPYQQSYIQVELRRRRGAYK